MARRGTTCRSEQAADVYTKLSVGDGLVSQIPALIISLSAALLVSKGGTRGATEKAVLSQLVKYPRALFVAALLMFGMAIAPGLPFFPFAAARGRAGVCRHTRRQSVSQRRVRPRARGAPPLSKQAQREAKNSVKEQMRSAEVELCLGKQLAARLLVSHNELAARVAKMRRKFARQYGFVVPGIKLSDSLSIPPKSYQIKIHGTVVASA